MYRNSQIDQWISVYLPYIGVISVHEHVYAPARTPRDLDGLFSSIYCY